MLPLAIHFLTKPRPVLTPLSTIRFVREAIQEKRSRHRLRDWSTLVLRMLAAFFVGVAVARPLHGPTAAPPLGEAETLTIVMLDVSQSMAAVDGGASVFERAREIAGRRFGSAFRNSRSRAALLLAGARTRAVFPQPTAQRLALRDEIGRAQPRPERIDVAAALRSAADMFASSSATNRELVIVSDFQRPNWSGADFAGVPLDVKIFFESAAAKEPLPNLAIVRAECSGRIEQGRRTRLEVEVANYSSATRSANVEVAIGETVHRLEGSCPPGMRTRLGSELRFADTGWTIGEARLTNGADALAADDRRPIALEVRPAAKLALATREPAAPRPSASYFLERALVPSDDPKSSLVGSLTRVAPSGIDAESLQPFDVVALVRPGKLTEQSAAALAGFVQRGRAIFYVVSEGSDAANLSMLKKFAGRDWKLPVEFVTPPADRAPKDRFLADVQSGQTPFAAFGDELTNLTAPLRFSRGLFSRPVEGGLADDVLASLNDRSAALVSTNCGSGNLVLWNVDLAATNLTSSPMFVPLASEILEKMLHRQRSTSAAICGEAYSALLPSSVGPLAGLAVAFEPATIKSVETGQLTEDATGLVFRSPSLGGPGVHLLKRGKDIAYCVASAAPIDECDLSSIDGAVLTNRLARGRSVTFRSSAELMENPRDDGWTYAIMAAVGCMLLEWMILRAMRS